MDEIDKLIARVLRGDPDAMVQLIEHEDLASVCERLAELSSDVAASDKTD